MAVVLLPVDKFNSKWLLVMDSMLVNIKQKTLLKHVLRILVKSLPVLC